MLHIFAGNLYQCGRNISLGRVFRNRDPLSVRTDEMREEHIVVAAGRTTVDIHLARLGPRLGRMYAVLINKVHAAGCDC